MSLLETKPTLMLGPAYGRKYRTAENARAEWNQGLDFKILVGEDAGRYCSIRDTRSLTDNDYTQVSIRLEIVPFAVVIKLDPNA